MESTQQEIPPAMLEAASYALMKARGYSDQAIDHLYAQAVLEAAGVADLLAALEAMNAAFSLDVYRMQAGSAFCDMEAAEAAKEKAVAAIAKANGKQNAPLPSGVVATAPKPSATDR